MTTEELSLAMLLEQIEGWRAMDEERQSTPYPQQEEQYLIHVPSKKFPELRATARAYNKAFKRADKNATHARHTRDKEDEKLWQGRDACMRACLFDIIGAPHDDEWASALYEYVFKCESDYTELAKTFVALTAGPRKD